MRLGGNRPPGDNPLLFSISGKEQRTGRDLYSHAKYPESVSPLIIYPLLSSICKRYGDPTMDLVTPHATDVLMRMKLKNKDILILFQLYNTRG